MGRYKEIFTKSIEEPEAFWGKAAESIDWYKKWDKVLDDTNPPFYSWFAGGEMNTCYNAVDRHVEGGRADQVAIIYDSPVTNTIQKFTYRELPTPSKNSPTGNSLTWWQTLPGYSKVRVLKKATQLSSICP